jgi:hypothetical protein
VRNMGRFFREKSSDILRKLNELFIELIGRLFWYSYQIIVFPFRHSFDISTLPEVDRIEVVAISNRPLKTIVEQDVINLLLTATKQYKKWYQLSIVIPPITLRFYSGNKLLLGLGIGSYFLTVQSGLYFLYKDVPKKEIFNLCEIIGITDEQLKHYD